MADEIGELNKDGSDAAELLKAETRPTAELFADEEFIRGVVNEVTKRARAQSLSVETAAGRKRVASTARKVSSSKVFLDNAGKEVAADIKARLDRINANRAMIRQNLDALRDEIRGPLTEWEAAEEARVTKHKEALEIIRGIGRGIDLNAETAETLNKRLEAIAGWADYDFQEFRDEAGPIIEATRAIVENFLRLRVDMDERAAEIARAKAKADEEARSLREAVEAAKREAEARAAALRNEWKAEREQFEASIRSLRNTEKQQADEIARLKAETARAEQEKPENYWTPADGPYPADLSETKLLPIIHEADGKIITPVPGTTGVGHQLTSGLNPNYAGVMVRSDYPHVSGEMDLVTALLKAIVAYADEGWDCKALMQNPGFIAVYQRVFGKQP